MMLIHYYCQTYKNGQMSVGMGRDGLHQMGIVQPIHNLINLIHASFTNPTTYVITPILPPPLISYYNIYYPAVYYRIPDIE